MGNGLLAVAKAASASSDGNAYVAIILGEAAIIVLLIVLFVQLRRRAQTPLTFVGVDPFEEARLEAISKGRDRVRVTAVESEPEPEEPAAPVIPPVVSWDMTGEGEAEGPLDAENVPIPAYNGPSLLTQTASPDIDFDLGVTATADLVDPPRTAVIDGDLLHTADPPAAR